MRLCTTHQLAVHSHDVVSFFDLQTRVSLVTWGQQGGCNFETGNKEKGCHVKLQQQDARTTGRARIPTAPQDTRTTRRAMMNLQQWYLQQSQGTRMTDRVTIPTTVCGTRARVHRIVRVHAHVTFVHFVHYTAAAFDKFKDLRMWSQNAWQSKMCDIRPYAADTLALLDVNWSECTMLWQLDWSHLRCSSSLQHHVKCQSRASSFEKIVKYVDSFCEHCHFSYLVSKTHHDVKNLTEIGAWTDHLVCRHIVWCCNHCVHLTCPLRVQFSHLSQFVWKCTMKNTSNLQRSFARAPTVAVQLTLAPQPPHLHFNKDDVISVDCLLSSSKLL